MRSDWQVCLAVGIAAAIPQRPLGLAAACNRGVDWWDFSLDRRTHDSGA